MSAERERMRIAVAAAFARRQAAKTTYVIVSAFIPKIYELTDQVDGTATTFTFSPTPSAISPIEIILDGMTLNEGSNNDYTINGVSSVTLTFVPDDGSTLLARYAEPA
tara:strand:+ start:423 stop:746 length:324 start_codon:yes stop_codon:yes gene_type:complete